MADSFFFVTICIFLAVALIVSAVAAARGSRPAKYFLWTWLLLTVAATPFVATTSASISNLAAGLMLLFFVYVIYLMNRHGVRQIEKSHEETRRVLAESNSRINEERRLISRRLHDDVNPSLIFCRNELNRLLPLIEENEKANAIAKQVISLVEDAYAVTRSIIKNTRIEVIDSVGLTVALESMISHFSEFSDKPIIHFKHNLPRRPDVPEEIAVNAYMIIREALFNAIKHSQARQVTVDIHHDGVHQYYVSVADDGVGMPKKLLGATEGSGIGLIDMRERARIIGANLRIEPSKQADSKRSGTRVSFSFSDQGL